MKQALNAPEPGEAVRPLFRSEAVDHVSSRHYGTIILSRSLSHSLVTMVFLALVLAIVSFFIFFSTTRKAQSQGVLLPTAGIIRVVPGQAGIIKEIRVREGQAVREGDILFVLASERSSAIGQSTERTVSSLMQNRRDSFNAEIGQSALQSHQRIAAALRRVDSLKAETARSDEQIALQVKRLALVEQSYERFRDLHATKYISAAQFQEKQIEVLDQQQRLADLKRAKAGTERELTAAVSDAEDLKVQGERDARALMRNVSALQQDLSENEARREFFIRAPKSGTATAITAEIGQTVTMNSNLVAVLPDGAELEAEIYVPSRSVGFVKPGMQVLLRYQAYPYQKFGQHKALVREVARASLRQEELTAPGTALPAGAASEPLYRIRLKLDKQNVLAYGQSMPLKPGMLIDASIMLEHRRLYEWILEPLFSISGRM